MSLLRKSVIVLLALFLLYATAGWFLLPRFVDQAIRDGISSRLGLESEFGQLTVYPFSFSAHLEDVVLFDRNGAPLFIIQSVIVHSGPLDFWLQQARLKSLALHQPQLNLKSGEPAALSVFSSLSALFAGDESAESSFQVETLELKGGSVLLPEAESTWPILDEIALDLTTGVFSELRSGRFEMSLTRQDKKFAAFTGTATVADQGVTGTLSYSGQPLAQVPLGSAGFDVTHAGLSVDTEFTAVSSPEFLQVELQQAQFAANALEFGLGEESGLGYEEFRAVLNAMLDLQPDGLTIRQIDLSTSDVLIHAFASAGAPLIEVPAGRLDLFVNNVEWGSGQMIPFRATAQVDEEGSIDVNGQWNATQGSAALLFTLEQMTLASLAGQEAGWLPIELADDQITASGRSQVVGRSTGSKDAADTMSVKRPVTLAASGELASGAKVSVSASSFYSETAHKSQVDIHASGLDAQLASDWVTVNLDRAVTDGKLDASLNLHTGESGVNGRLDLEAHSLVLGPPQDEARSALNSTEGLVALLQDPEGHIGFSVALDHFEGAERIKLPDWMGRSVLSYVQQLGEYPIASLAGMLGTQPANLENAFYQPGQAGLSDPAREGLEWLKTALQRRPGLSLSVIGGYDPDADQYALADQQIRLHVNLATAINAQARNDSVPVNLNDPKAQAVLDEFATSRLGADKVGAMATQFGGVAGEEGLQFSDAEKNGFYRTLYAALVENEKISERAMLSLARFRARTIIDELARRGIDRGRLTSEGPVATRTDFLNGIPIRLEWGLYAPENNLDNEEPRPSGSGFR